MSLLIRLLEWLLVAERIAMPVADGTGAPSAVSGYRVIAADLAIDPSVSVVIPAKNEARNLHVLASIPSRVDEIVLANGDLGDDTVVMATLPRPDVTVVTHKGDGKGDVLLTGFRTCRGEIVVMPNADGSTDDVSFVVPL